MIRSQFQFLKLITGFSQRIDDTHYLIGTYRKSIYQIELDENTKLIKKTTKVKMTGPNSIPDIMGGFAQKINDTHYLIGTFEKGIYQVAVDNDGMIIKSTPVKMTGLNSIPSIFSGFSQKIDDTHYLIGTENKGIYQVAVDSDGMVIKAE